MLIREVYESVKLTYHEGPPGSACQTHPTFPEHVHNPRSTEVRLSGRCGKYAAPGDLNECDVIRSYVFNSYGIQIL